MKVLFGIVAAQLLFFATGPGDINKINSLKSEAKAAYVKGNYQVAIDKYKYLIDSLGVKEDEVMLNLANAYFNSKDTLNAPTTYMPLTQSTDTKIKSIANQQLGVMANRNGKFEEALNYFKQALKTAPDNEDARYNYEMVKKKIEEEKKKQEQQNKDQNKENKDDKKDQNKDKKDQQNKDQQDQKNKEDQKKDQQDQQKKDQQEQKDKEQKSKEDKDKKEKEQQEKEEQEKNAEKKDLPPSVSEKLKEMQMSEEKAKMILEAMKNQEVQYLQQNKRKASKPKDKGKPDW
jgi:Ca-activated chloride channel homolog